ncbi:putative nucleotidyltransferase [Arthrobacter stackebrandtii]|uniref:Nucleotidyltransferase n=1 Tax=Arthrobacter stackebrandtii TaxID=272161 RepID=A0ABS4YU05_9MICC|nr:nucleotidyltransferase domain-containing protein [Arthrobacter stackebrandtii]MBP2412284.1 putative nucleotidyltransferase [Arthrobacter stackebrandtii]
MLESRRGEFQALLAKYAATNPKLFGSVARGTAHGRSDIGIFVDTDSVGGNLLMQASGLM